MTNLRDLLLLNLWMVPTTQACWGGWPGWSGVRAEMAVRVQACMASGESAGKSQTKCMPRIRVYVEMEVGVC